MTREISFRQRLAKNTLASIGTNVWTMVLTIGTLPIILHGLGAASFGVWVFLQTFSATSGWLSIPATGLSTSSTRRVASTIAEEDPQARRRAAGGTFFAFIAAGLLFGLILAIATPTLLDGALDLGGMRLPSLRLVGMVFAAQVVAEHVCLAATSVLEGMQDVALARLVDAVRKSAMAVSVAAVATAGGDILGVALASAAAATIVTVGALAWLVGARRITIGAPVASEVRTMVSYAGTVSALAGTGVLHRTMDRTIAGMAFGPQAVALIEIATQVQAGGAALLSASTYPVLSSAPWLESTGGREALRALLARSTKYSVLLTFPACALSITLAGPFIATWVGAEFSEAAGLTQVAVVYVLLAAPLQAGSNLLQGIGRAGQVLRASVLSVGVNLVASLFFVQVVGLVGVFLGTIAGSVALIPLLAGSISRETNDVGFTAARDAIVAALPPSIAASASAGAVVLLGWSAPATLVAGGALGCAAAAVTAVAFSLSSTERHELRSALRVRSSDRRS